MNQMDQFTQKNAAMVEETTAVTHRLADSATALSGLVGQFRTSDMAAAPVGRPPLQAPRPAARTATHPAPAAPRPAGSGARAVPSPARGMVGTLTRAFGTGGGNAATAASDWEEF